MGYPTKVQCIERKSSAQFYINLPTPLAQALDFIKGEMIEWTIHDKGHLILTRQDTPVSPVPVKKTAR